MTATTSPTSVPLPTPANSHRSTGFYAPELDSLRCLAVGAVFITHFSWTLKSYADWGVTGVRLFYVLSGFLITHLLFRARARCEAGQLGATLALRQFFVRRIFRLWPLYYASLAAAYLLQVDGTQSPLAWHALFATNHYVFHYQIWPSLLSHYWTLAVEQQFYVVWPFAVLLLPFRALGRTVGAMIALGAIARWLPLAAGWSKPEYSYVLLPGCADFFGFGAAIAWGWHDGLLDRLGSRRRLRAFLLGFCGWLVLGAMLKTYGRQPLYWNVGDGFIQALGFSLLTVYLLRHGDSLLARGLRWRPLVYLGQISYGLYIIHNFMHWLGPRILRHVIGTAYFSHEWAHLLYYSTLTVALAIVSYHCFEVPVRRFGQRLA